MRQFQLEIYPGKVYYPIYYKSSLEQAAVNSVKTAC